LQETSVLIEIFEKKYLCFHSKPLSKFSAEKLQDPSSRFIISTAAKSLLQLFHLYNPNNEFTALLKLELSFLNYKLAESEKFTIYPNSRLYVEAL